MFGARPFAGGYFAQGRAGQLLRRVRPVGHLVAAGRPVGALSRAAATADLEPTSKPSGTLTIET